MEHILSPLGHGFVFGLGEFCLLVGLEQDGGIQKWAFTSSFRAKRGTIRREIPFLRSNPQLLRWIASLFFELAVDL